jgi:sulfatase modifying factor 1
MLKPSLIASILVASLAVHAPAVTIDWSPVGNPGNANDPATGSLYGAVPYAYNIGTKDVTASQYVEFLNAKDAGGTNPLFLYNGNMSNATYGGISFTAGNPSGSKYGVIAGRGNHPVNFTSWYDSIRFANWLNNGQGGGDTETGAYTLGTLGAGGVPLAPPLTHNAGSQVWLPTENEWYKAAYYAPGSSSYNLYPTSSNLAPTASGPTALSNHANFVPGGPGNLTDVGVYTGTTSPYGAFDMGGDVFQWNEALITNSFGSYRGFRGGSFNDISNSLQSSVRGHGVNPSDVNNVFGFRVAAVPEPSSFILAALGLAGLAAWTWNRNRAQPAIARS